MGHFLGYIRVSRVGDRSNTLLSPTLQEREIRPYAKARGHDLEMLPAELDRSGGDDERPILQGAIERIARGEREGVIVWKFDRFTRSLESSIQFLKLIEDVGGQLLSTSEQIDPSTPSGRMTRNILFSVAQGEREQRAEGIDKSKADAIARGVWTAPRVPIGYVKNAERELEVDPAAALVVTEVFRRRGAGASWRELADYVRNELGRSCHPATIRQMVRRRTYLGEARQGEHVNPKAHEAIVDRATWEAAQVPHAKPARGVHGEALLGGLLRCAGCSRRMSSTFRKGKRVYNCRRYHAGGTCLEPAAISAHLVEPYVTEALFAHAREVAFTSSERTKAVDLAERELEEAEAELRLYQETVKVSDVGAEHFRAGMEVRVQAVEEARRRLAAARLASPRVLPGTLAEIWPNLTVVERRQVLRSSFSVVWVRRGKGNVAGRVRLISATHDPVGLSVQGRPAGLPVPLAWDGDLEGEVGVAGAEHGGEPAGGAAL